VRFRVLAIDRMASELEISDNLKYYHKMGCPYSLVLHRMFLSVWILFLRNEAFGVSRRPFLMVDDTEQQAC
jgi:hypothetical protein